MENTVHPEMGIDWACFTFEHYRYVMCHMGAEWSRLHEDCKDKEHLNAFALGSRRFPSHVEIEAGGNEGYFVTIEVYDEYGDELEGNIESKFLCYPKEFLNWLTRN